MTREEEIQKLIDEETGIDNYGSIDYQIGVCDGVRFADKTMINKACEWLENRHNIEKYLGILTSRSVDLAEAFKKAMENENMNESYKSHKISEKDFIKDEYDELICEYNGYRIEINYSNEDLYWCADAFDLEAEQYVFYPCLRVPDKDKTQLNKVIQLVSKYIDKKIKSNCEEGDILIYLKDVEESAILPYSTRTE